MIHSSGNSGALFAISGEVANNATWDEYIYFSQAGSGMVLTGLAFQFQFRSDGNSTSADLTLTTAASQLTITNDDNGAATVLRINVPYTTISGLEGDYVADLVSKDTDNKLTAWAHGVVSFRQSPIAF